MKTKLPKKLLAQQQIVVENKATLLYNSIFEVQTLTYLRLLNLRLGLVINFGEKYVKDGVHRVINPNYKP